MNRDLAIALGYQPTSDLAPHVLASGEGVIAERMMRRLRYQLVETCRAEPFLDSCIDGLGFGGDGRYELRTGV